MKDALAYYAQEALYRLVLVFGLDLKGPPPAISTWGPRTRFEAWWKNGLYDRFSYYMPRDTSTKTAVLYRGKKRMVLIPYRKYLNSIGFAAPKLAMFSLELDADPKELGKAVTDILSSATLEEKDDKSHTKDGMDDASRLHTKALREGLAIGTRAALWSPLHSCSLSLLDGVVTIEPSENEGRGGFQWIDPLVTFVAPQRDAEAVGLMTYLALGHCR